MGARVVCSGRATVGPTRLCVCPPRSHSQPFATSQPERSYGPGALPLEILRRMPAPSCSSYSEYASTYESTSKEATGSSSSATSTYVRRQLRKESGKTTRRTSTASSKSSEERQPVLTEARAAAPPEPQMAPPSPARSRLTAGTGHSASVSLDWGGGSPRSPVRKKPACQVVVLQQGSHQQVSMPAPEALVSAAKEEEVTEARPPAAGPSTWTLPRAAARQTRQARRKKAKRAAQAAARKQQAQLVPRVRVEAQAAKAAKVAKTSPRRSSKSDPLALRSAEPLQGQPVPQNPHKRKLAALAKGEPLVGTPSLAARSPALSAQPSYARSLPPASPRTELAVAALARKVKEADMSDLLEEEDEGAPGGERPRPKLSSPKLGPSSRRLALRCAQQQAEIARLKEALHAREAPPQPKPPAAAPPRPSRGPRPPVRAPRAPPAPPPAWTPMMEMARVMEEWPWWGCWGGPQDAPHWQRPPRPPAPQKTKGRRWW